MTLIRSLALRLIYILTKIFNINCYRYESALERVDQKEKGKEGYRANRA